MTVNQVPASPDDGNHLADEQTGPTGDSDPEVPAPVDVSTAVTSGEATAGKSASRRRWSMGRVMRWTFGIGALLLLLVVGTATVLFINLQNRIYHPLPPTPTEQVAVVSPTPELTSLAGGEGTAVAVASPTPNVLRTLPSGRFNILVLGTDKRPDDEGTYARSDTLLLANVDTISNTVHIMSIPRDLAVHIPGYIGINKINSAYFFGEYYQEPGGGQALAVRTVSQLFNVPIEYYVAINFQGFEKVVNSVGGIDIDVPYSLDDYDYPTDEQGDLYGTMHVHFDAGWQHMDGPTALEYARTRHADNDFARSKRQLQIILAVRQKAMTLNVLPSLPGLIDALGGMVETNIPVDRQLALAQLGYNIEASDIMTTSIDSSMIYPVTLVDGSEGLQLDQKAAQPMLDAFFGWGSPQGMTGALDAPEALPTRSSRQQLVPTPAPTADTERHRP